MKKLTLERKFYLLLIILVAVGSLIGWQYWPYVQDFLAKYRVDETVYRYASIIEMWTRKFGLFGWILIVFINVLQIVVAFLPGEPVELATGVLYGWFWGSILCVIGVVIGEAIVFLITRRYGIKLVNWMFRKDVTETKFFENTARIQSLTFILFLLPGVPKDVLTYVAGLSKIKLGDFLIISTLARTPSIISSALIGGSAISGDFTMTYWATIVTTLFGLIGIFFKDSILLWADTREEMVKKKLEDSIEKRKENKES